MVADSPIPLPYKQTIFEGILLYILGFGFELAFRIRGPPNRGFFCNDLSIRLHKEDEIVPLRWLVVYVYSCGLLPVIFVELYRLLKYDPGRFYSQYERLRGKTSRLLIRCVIFIGWFHVAFMSTWALTATAKFSIGRLRPYYIEACQPDIDLTECYNTPKYFSEHDFNCTTTNRRLLKEAHLSFFSGHSSISTVAAVFAILYIQARLVGKTCSKIGPILLQVTFMASALFISFSRVVDHNHHPEDVIVGIIVGGLTGVITTVYCAKLFHQNDETIYEKEQKVLSNDSLVV
uniref:Phosphatidic acid phosphatase type 2/haloperoxidase domain-containing protein n=2 Tax=Panagrolaimus sp. JU765 TaxID=591449 RepID=A0AC34QX87_9BILA